MPLRGQEFNHASAFGLDGADGGAFLGAFARVLFGGFGRATLLDHNGLVVQGASVTIEFVNPDGDVKSTGSGTTSAPGIASVSYAPPNGAKQGTWIVRVASVSGTSLTYVSGQNVVTQVDFTLTN